MSFGSDSLYALGTMLLGKGAAAELCLVKSARLEAREANRKWTIRGFHTPSHVGCPPNECADVTALMGQLQFNLLSEMWENIVECPSPLLSVHEPVLFSIAHALAWQEIDEAPDPLCVAKGFLCKNRRLCASMCNGKRVDVASC